MCILCQKYRDENARIDRETTMQRVSALAHSINEGANPQHGLPHELAAVKA
jgi:hypothetical protein